MVKLLDLLSSVEVVEDGRSSFSGSNGDIGLVDLCTPVSGQGARVLLVDGVLVQLALFGITHGVRGDYSRAWVSGPAFA
jgi:hypothetical protein